MKLVLVWVDGKPTVQQARQIFNEPSTGNILIADWDEVEARIADYFCFDNDL